MLRVDVEEDGHEENNSKKDGVSSCWECFYFYFQGRSGKVFW